MAAERGYAAPVVDPSPQKITANDFTRQWQDIGDDVLAAVDRVGRSGWLMLGEEVEAFEREFAAWWGVPHAVGVASGLDAMEIALRCAGVPPGARPDDAADRVRDDARDRAQRAPSRSGATSTTPAGIDLDQPDAALGADDSIRALLPVHLYGHPAGPGAVCERSPPSTTSS